MGLALMQLGARQEGEHWEEVYWTSFEVPSEGYACVTQHASQYKETLRYEPIGSLVIGLRQAHRLARPLGP